MPYLQTKTTGSFGFLPADHRLAVAFTNPYAVSSSEAIINAGDAVVLSSIANTAGGPAIVKNITGVWSTGILGVAAHSLASGAGQTASVFTSTGLLLVYDSPDQTFVVSDAGSSVGGGLASSQIGYNVSILATGPVGSTGPNTNLNRSVQSINGATTSALLPFKVVALHPIDNATSSALGTVSRKWIVQSNAQSFEPNYVSVTTA